MLLGTAKADITPPPGTWLAGYNNGRGADSVYRKIQLRAFWFQEAAGSDASDAVCLITAELLGFGESITRTLRSDLAKEFGLQPEAIMLAASHTHCGPQTCENMPNNGGPLVPEYIAQLRKLTKEAVAQARSNMRPSRLRVGRGHLSGYAINRRLMIDGESHLAPNPQGTRDDEVTVIIGSDEATDEVSAVLFHYTCHPTLLGDPAVSGDYPGEALHHVEREMPSVSAAFLPGCFGDVRPNAVLVGGKKFRAATMRDAEEFGGALGEEVVRVVKASQSSTALHPRISYSARVLPLPLQNGSQEIDLTLQRIDLADELTIIAMGGEMGVDYGHFIKSLDRDKHFIPVGYANGLIGYVCPTYQYDEGGFEPYSSCEAYSLPAPFKADSEDLIHNAIREMIA